MKQYYSFRKFPLVVFLISALAVATAPAQSFWVGEPGGFWNDEDNWAGGVPDSQDGEAVFDDSAAVDMNGFTASLATLNALGEETNSVVISNGMINLDSSGGAWSIFVNSPSGTLRLLTGLSGVSDDFVAGLSKSGAGTLSFLGNTNDLGFSGTVFLDGGKILINQDSSLGAAGNDLVMAGGTVLIYGTTNATGSTTLGADRTITIAGGGQGGIEALGGHTLNIAGNIENDGSPAILRKYGAGTVVLSGAANYGGRTIVSGGTLQLGPGTVLAQTNIEFTGTSTLNLGTLAPNIPSVTFVTDTNQSRVFTVTNGSIQITNAAANFVLNGAQGTTADLSGLSNFTFNGPSRSFQVQPSANNASNNTNFVLLAAAGEGSNNITAANMTIGGAASSAGSANGSQLTLGKVTVINVTNLNIGGFNASGVITTPVGVNGTSVTIRSTDGTNPAGTVRIGETSSGTRSGSGTLTVDSGTLDLVVTNLLIGRHLAAATNAETSTLTFSNGTLVAESIILSDKPTGSGTPVITATINQGGGTTVVDVLTMGNGSPTNGILPRLLPTYNLSGGSIRAGSITTGIGVSGTNFAANSSRRINWMGGTIRPFDEETNLSISGTAGSGGSIEILGLGPATKTFTTDGGNIITLAPTTWLNANGGDIRIDPGEGGTFTTTGAFSVGSAQFPSTNALHTNVINASITVASGTVNLTTATRIFGLGDRTNPGITNSFNVLGGTANLGLTSNRMLVGNKSAGEVNVSGGVLNVTGNAPVYIGGDFSFGASGARGSLNISAPGAVTIGGSGSVFLGQANTNASSTDIEGTINLDGGTLTTSRPILSGTPVEGTTATGTVNFNGGTLAAGASVANILNVTTATVSASGLTYNTGTFDSGMTQNLAGTGTLTVAGSGTLRLNGTNTPPVVVDSGATLGGTGSAGDVTVNGTLAPGAPDGDGAFTTTGTLTVPGTARFRIYGNGINDRLVASGGAALGGTVAVTIDETYTPASGDTFDLVDGTITGTPALDLPALQGGLTWVTNSFAATGVLSITNGGEPTGNYANWLANYPSLAGADALGTADPDGDGFSNNLEYAFDGNPTVGTPALLKVTKSGSDAVFSFVARKNPPGGVTYSVQTTTNLATGPWTPTEVTVTVAGDQTGILIPADYERRQFSVPASGKNFYRVQATITD